MLVRIANREDPDETASWVCTVSPAILAGNWCLQLYKIYNTIIMAILTTEGLL